MAPGITFRVHDVAPERKPPPLPQGVRIRKSVRRDGPELLATSVEEGAALVPVMCNHALVGAVYLAYGRHYPLVLSPDAVWITLAQGFAQHIKLHADSMRADLVRHRGKKKLVARPFSLDTRDTAFWSEVIEELTTQIRQHASPELADLVCCDFSTTGPVERMVSQVVLMDVVSPFFQYGIDTICGIPSITLTGTHQDWVRLCLKVGRLRHYGLSAWVERILPICHQFVLASKGEIDRSFWRRIIHVHEACGSDIIDGWIAALFPYLHDEATGDFSKENTGGSVDLLDFPPGMSTVAIELATEGAPVEHVEIRAGLGGVRWDADTGVVSPRIRWSVLGEPALVKRLRQGDHDLRPPPSAKEIARHDHILSRLSASEDDPTDAKSFIEMLYGFTDGVDLHVREGRATYRIRPLAEIETISVVRADLLRKLEANIAYTRANVFPDYEVREAARRSKTTQSWLRFCDLPDGSFLAISDESGEVAHMTEAAPAGPIEAPRIVASSLREAFERALAGGPTPWFEGSA